MTRRAARVGASVGGLLLALTACAPSPPSAEPTGTGGSGARSAAIDVDTPALRAAKKAAGIADCPAPGRTGSDAAPVADGLPDATLPCFGGGRDVRLADLRGPLVLNVWASYCAPCRTEMPLLEQFHRRYGAKVGLIGVDFQDPQTDSAMQLATRSEVTYPLVADVDGLFASAERARVIGLPTTILVDADGRVVRTEAVEITSVEQLADLVRRYLGVDL